MIARKKGDGFVDPLPRSSSCVTIFAHDVFRNCDCTVSYTHLGADAGSKLARAQELQVPILDEGMLLRMIGAADIGAPNTDTVKDGRTK